MTYIKKEELQDVIRHRYNVDARHTETVPIKETLHGKTIWDGNVEVFELIGHPKRQKYSPGPMPPRIQKNRAT